MSDISVIEADLSDANHQVAIRNLVDDYARDPMGNGEGLPAEILDRLIPGLQQHATSAVWLAMDGDEPVGVAVCFIGFSTFAGRPLINIHDFAVKAPRRGAGIGRTMLETIEERARSLSCCKLTLEVRTDNHRARGLYRSFGFGDFEFASGDSEVVFWQKSLQNPA